MRAAATLSALAVGLSFYWPTPHATDVVGARCVGLGRAVVVQGTRFFDHFRCARRTVWTTGYESYVVEPKPDKAGGS